MAKRKETKEKEVDTARMTDKERVAKHQVLSRVIIEVLGAPKSHVEEAIQLVVDKVRSSKGLEVVSESTYEAEEKGKLFVTFSEIEIWFHSHDDIIQFLFNFTPSSIEILQPADVSFKSQELSGFFNDFLLKMHDLGLKLKDTSAKTQLLQKNTDTLVRNFVNHCLAEPITIDEISKKTGIPADNVKAILDHYEKAKLLENKGDKYSLKRK